MSGSPIDRLHPADLSMFIRLVAVGWTAIEALGLTCASIEPLDGQDAVRLGRLGDCQRLSKRIRLTLRFRAADGRWDARRPDAELWDTLAHEIAHLEYPHHRSTFWAYMRVVEDEIAAVRR